MAGTPKRRLKYDTLDGLDDELDRALVRTVESATRPDDDDDGEDADFIDDDDDDELDDEFDDDDDDL